MNVYKLEKIKNSIRYKYIYILFELKKLYTDYNVLNYKLTIIFFIIIKIFKHNI